MRRINLFKDGANISDEVELTEGKANPFGWSQYRMMYGVEFVGWLESGYPMNLQPGVTFTEEEISDFPKSPTDEKAPALSEGDAHVSD